jgi:hypothetical protein
VSQSLATSPTAERQRIPFGRAVCWGPFGVLFNLGVIIGFGYWLTDDSALWGWLSLVTLAGNVVVGVVLLAIRRTRWVGASVLLALVVTLVALALLLVGLSQALD